jgi:hypothetical protein
MSEILFRHARAGSISAEHGYSALRVVPAIFAVSETASIENDSWVVHTDAEGLATLKTNAQTVTQELSYLISTISRLALSFTDPDAAGNWPELPREALSGIESLRELQHELIDVIGILAQATPSITKEVVHARS